jgi:hypothetical protein
MHSHQTDLLVEVPHHEISTETFEEAMQLGPKERLALTGFLI